MSVELASGGSQSAPKTELFKRILLLQIGVAISLIRRIIDETSLANNKPSTSDKSDLIWRVLHCHAWIDVISETFSENLMPFLGIPSLSERFPYEASDLLLSDRWLKSRLTGSRKISEDEMLTPLQVPEYALESAAFLHGYPRWKLWAALAPFLTYQAGLLHNNSKFCAKELSFKEFIS